MPKTTARTHVDCFRDVRGTLRHIEYRFSDNTLFGQIAVDDHGQTASFLVDRRDFRRFAWALQEGNDLTVDLDMFEGDAFMTLAGVTFGGRTVLSARGERRQPMLAALITGATTLVRNTWKAIPI